MIRGDVSSVRAAAEACAEAAGRVGELKAAHVIPRPGDTVVAPCSAGAALMKILVANLGSTSFKYRLYDLERRQSTCWRRGGDRADRLRECQGHHQARRRRLGDRSGRSATTGTPSTVPGSAHRPETGSSRTPTEVSAIGFKAVHAKAVSGVQFVTEECSRRWRNLPSRSRAQPPYTRAMRMLGERFPCCPLVAAFETGFHQTIPEANQRYAIPEEWATSYGDPRGDFTAQPSLHRRPDGGALGREDLKVISCHLGGCSSLCAIRDGESVGDAAWG